MNERFQIVLLEYEKLRDESIQSLQAQQAILQWSIASFGAILGAALLLSSQGPGMTVPVPVSVTAFGLLVPAFAALCCLAWFGELIRMERIGFYLRGVEFDIALAAKASAADRDGFSPLRWETFIAFKAKRSIGTAKQMVGYFGSLGIYCVVVTTSLAAALWQVWMIGLPQLTLKTAQLLTVVAAVELAAFLMTVLYLVRSLLKTANTAVRLDVDPTKLSHAPDS